jgi:hypothetical protein
MQQKCEIPSETERSQFSPPVVRKIQTGNGVVTTESKNRVADSIANIEFLFAEALIGCCAWGCFDPMIRSI